MRVYVRRKMSVMEKKHKEEAERAQLENELEMAAQIQVSMLPSAFPAFPERGEFDVFAHMDPARNIGGDFFDFFLIDDDHLGLVIADVSGKGIPAALFMMVSKILIKNSALAGMSPARTLETVNRQICENNDEEMFVTVWLGVLEISSGKLTAANAGHEYPVVKTPRGKFSLLKDKHGLVVGGMDSVIYRDYELILSPGAKLFVYTDGVPEATDGGGRFFGIDRMLDVLNRSRDGSPYEILRDVHRAVDTFVGDAEQFDDLTMLCLEYKGPLTSAT
jgi:serine phosphatase RsbU (regulator of sigma subunit)